MTTQMLTAQERFKAGQQCRKQVPRTEHSTLKPKERGIDALTLLRRSVKGRLPGLVKMKNELMAASPFGYYRGAVPVMAYDLSRVPNTGICCQLCGDAHVRNLGAFAGPDGRLVFDVNDYDETIVGPFEWDVKRMAASLMLAGRGASMKESRCEDAALLFLETYRTMMTRFARMPVLEVARYQVHRLGEVAPVAGILLAAQRATPMHNLQALTEEDSRRSVHAAHALAGAAHLKTAPKPGRVFKTLPPLLRRVTGAEAKKVVRALVPYEQSLQPERRHFLAQYRPVDVAFKVVGTGSVGLRDFCIYMEGIGKKDPLFLQIKEEVRSAWEPYIGKATKNKARAHWPNEGRRVVEGERAMQVQSDPFLGWTAMEGRHYLVRQLNDHKASLQLDGLKAAELREYAAVCGEMLARGHARSGDSARIAGYLGGSPRFDEAIAAFARAYADQTETDWKELVKDLKG